MAKRLKRLDSRRCSSASSFGRWVIVQKKQVPAAALFELLRFWREAGGKMARLRPCLGTLAAFLPQSAD
ncbi:hypothetical protein [Xaviernesmea oryzae]|uniref:hypothetical protein n=1 Tax=Xaviernesmea oryzae TaxID=464029 RepID=UPI001113C200|nr:hypothetical protein [Xaviernesmea oryzae]